MGVSEGIVFNIQDYSIHDGPGIRTVVFLKGCPLVCRWCSNPESQRIDPEIAVIERLCTKCGRCIDVCPAGANRFTEGGTIIIDRSICMACGACEEECSSHARKLYGKRMSVDEVVAEVERSSPFFMRSEGGVTFSGGEPTVQWQFLENLLMHCKEKYIHTAVETCGYIRERSVLERLLPHVDLFLYDIKCIDDEKHRVFTGVSNQSILENARFISSQAKPMMVRIPVIPGFNNTAEEMGELAEFSSRLSSVVEVHLLPYHELGRSKYRMLDREYGMEGSLHHEDESLHRCRAVIESTGLTCRID
jgi:pyruvate formate lyase activating enzyme